jgi:ABC-2 type transport system permease protein
MTPTTVNLPRIYLLEAKFELLKMMRLPAYVLPTIAFPVMFYLLFGLGFRGNARGIDLAHYLLATYGAFGIIGAALFGFGVGVAVERGQGWMLLKRATPMPPFAYFTAKVAMSTLFGTVIVLAMGLCGGLFGGVRLPAGTWIALVGSLVLGSIPFCFAGLTLGYLVGPNAAPGVANLIHLPMGFLAGLWIPLPGLPKVVQQIAQFLPQFHFGQLALGTIGYGDGQTFRHVTFLAAFTVLAALAAWWAYRRDEGRLYG